MDTEIPSEPDPAIVPGHAPATADAVLKPNVQNFEKFKERIEGQKKTLDVTHQIYVIHTDHSRKISSNVILTELLKVAKLTGNIDAEFPFRVTPTIDTNEGKTYHCLLLYIASKESYESCKAVSSLKVSGHTLTIKSGDIFNQDIEKKKTMKRIILKNVPIYCVIEFAKQLENYVEITDINKDLTISPQGNMSAKVMGFKKPMPKHLFLNKNGYTVKVETKVDGYTMAEITKFNGEGLLNQPWERAFSDPGVNEWRAGAAARAPRGFVTCYFCNEPGHSKVNCVKYLTWKKKAKNYMQQL